MLAELSARRGLVWQLCRRDIAARYKQSLLGVAWAVLMPLSVVAIFALLNRSRVLPIAETSVAYPLFAYLGVLSWQLFARGLGLGAHSIVANISLLSQVKVPGEAFVLAAVGQSAFEFLMGCFACVALFAWYGVMPQWTILLTPLILLILLAAAIGLGFLFGLANAALRDVSSMLPMLTTLWMFATPVVYPPSTVWPWAALNVLNPMAPLISNIRSLAFEGRLVMIPELCASTIFSVAVLLIGWRLFHLLEPKIAERL